MQTPDNEQSKQSDRRQTEESIRAMCSKQLQRLGLEVLTAEDGRQAVNRYRERKEDIALVLLDLTMPHMNTRSKEKECPNNGMQTR